eukprot:TRINITY_DN5929_c0_g1_i3.p1 TRINITY_DN5929_c0_g1~~TRINITY_DN5929_c0_g1_i3.p1  ORF type:complete len:730 (+),score=179.10 TRINITY_DN5929_c0_g1_i3:282-2192(+)
MVSEALLMTNRQLHDDVNFLRHQVGAVGIAQHQAHNFEVEKARLSAILGGMKEVLEKMDHHAAMVESNFKVPEREIRRDQSTSITSVSEANLSKWKRSAEYLFEKCRSYHKELLQTKADLERVEKMLSDRNREVQKYQAEERDVVLISVVNRHVQTEDTDEFRRPIIPDSRFSSEHSLKHIWDRILSGRIIPPSGRTMTLQNMHKFIQNIYKEKVDADNHDDEERVSRQSLPEFLYNKYMKKFGMKTVTEQNLVDLFDNINRLLPQSLRTHMFGKFLGILANEAEYPPTALDFYLKLHDLLRQSKVDKWYEEDAQGKISVSAQRAALAANEMLAQTPPGLRQRFFQALKDMAYTMDKKAQETHGSASSTLKRSTTPSAHTSKPIPSRHQSSPARSNPTRQTTKETATNNARNAPSTSTTAGSKDINQQDVSFFKSLFHGLFVDYDEFLDFAVRHWMHEQDLGNEYLGELFRAADVNHDETLSYEEFCSFMKFADPLSSQRQVERMYEEAIKHSERDNLDLETFLKVARSLQFYGGSRNASKALMEFSQKPASVADAFKMLEEHWNRGRAKLESDLRFVRDLGRTPAKVQLYNQLLERTKAFELVWSRFDSSATHSFHFFILLIFLLSSTNVEGKKK